MIPYKELQIFINKLKSEQEKINTWISRNGTPIGDDIKIFIKNLPYVNENRDTIKYELIDYIVRDTFSLVIRNLGFSSFEMYQKDKINSYNDFLLKFGRLKGMIDIISDTKGSIREALPCYNIYHPLHYMADDKYLDNISIGKLAANHFFNIVIWLYEDKECIKCLLEKTINLVDKYKE